MRADANFLDMYLHATGISDVPPQYTRWVALTVIAAAVEDRVWAQKAANDPRVIPNLYTILTGPSGVSKGRAIGFGMKLLNERIHLHYGSATYKSLVDYMVAGNSRFLLVMPELASDMGGRKLADMMVKHLTEWYTAFDQKMTEGTRGHGLLEYDPPTINALFGTTTEWLVESISKEAVASGFFGRSIVINAEYDFQNMVYETTVPPDYEQCLGELKRRLREMTHMKGEFKLTAAAKELDKYWFHTRREPKPGMEPFFQREAVLVLKLAMLMSLTDGFNLVIDVAHIEAAHTLVAEIRQYLPHVMEECLADPVTRCYRWVLRIAGSRGRTNRKYLTSLGRTLGYSRNIIGEALIMGEMEGVFKNKRIGSEDYVYYIEAK